ncbi:acetate/propionate family kinase [bacterium]|nr:acetate/propionate family kinase [bacterium]
MKILVLNCGSSSLKYRLIDMPSEQELAGGEAQRVGPLTAEPSRIYHHNGRQKKEVVVPMPDHAEAFRQVIRLLDSTGMGLPDALGHRLVHGGTLFDRDSLLTHELATHLDELAPLAPIHNPPTIALIQACAALYPDLPQVLVPDTAFHTCIPDYAADYALPRELTGPMGLRKFGFHGISHGYVTAEAARILDVPPERFNAVSCHLGSGGASLCAVRGGHSVDNSMGWSPLQGLVMSTRCGDLDPAVTLRLIERAGGNCEAVEKILNRSSGLLGLSQVSADIRDILRALEKDTPADPEMALAAQVYLWRLRKYLGAYLLAAGPCQAVIFTDTIGETVPLVRWAVCSDMRCFGLELDPQKNLRPGPLPSDISTPESPVRILVVATNEELAIARQSWNTLCLRAA